jgi:HemY protein
VPPEAVEPQPERTRLPDDPGVDPEETEDKDTKRFRLF